mgnify:CR=1 FL=1
MKKAIWHYHHSTFLVEFPAETIESRRVFIDSDKPLSERALRHRLLRPVVGKLPVSLTQAAQTYAQAGQAPTQAYRTWRQAEQAWTQAYQDNLSAISALHAIECPDCPWSTVQETIFTRKNGDGEWY